MTYCIDTDIMIKYFCLQFINKIRNIDPLTPSYNLLSSKITQLQLCQLYIY